MGNLVRRWALTAGTDGVILRQLDTKDVEEAISIQIEYRTSKISTVARAREHKLKDTHLGIFGVIGILNLVSASYAIVIKKREEIAQIKGKSVYAVRDVCLIPLNTQSEADEVINETLLAARQQEAASNDTDTELSDVEENEEPSNDQGKLKLPDAAAVEPSKGLIAKGTSFTKNVIQDRGKYGRFAERWISKNGSNLDARRKQGINSEEDLTSTHPEQEDDEASAGNNENAKQMSSTATPDEPPRKMSAIESLGGRIQRIARLYFSTSGFYFSYDIDLSKRLDHDVTPVSELPLWRRFDALYFWNASLAKPFVDAGRDELVLPLMQGFIGQRSVSISQTAGDQNDLIEQATADTTPTTAEQSKSPDKEAPATDPLTHDLLLTLISRRSIKRAGLRYLRRGVDDSGNVANAVETEQILSSASWNASDKIYSLTQVRGSIPLHFTQSPYSFKPTPIIQGSESTNQAAMRKHFEFQQSRYGEVQAVSLVDKHGPENSVGQLYKDHVARLNESQSTNGKEVGFNWFDFHKECKGMKFENVSILLSSIESRLKSFGWAIEEDDRQLRTQNGVLRTNCMDCLDRTNVVQSAVAGWALEQQLLALGINIDLKTDPKTQWFNSLWADNGDAISRQYAGTAALKGDFTRTRKRNWTGALSDFSLTLNRYYRNVFGDYFLQTCIDFFLGNARAAVFDEFETNMMAKDYALDMDRIHQNAIDTCVKIAIEDLEEDFIDGWVVSCPREANTLRTLPFEECVILLTNTAFYFCRFDWKVEKLSTFERVFLSDIQQIWRGAYITNAFGNNLDEYRNVGFALRYRPAEKLLIRRNTRTLQNDEIASDGNAGKSEQEDQKEPEKHQKRLLAFKILPVQSGNSENTDERQVVKRICGKLHAAMVSANRKERPSDDPVPEVKEQDIISAAEAKKSTGYVESIGYSLKKLVWS